MQIPIENTKKEPKDTTPAPVVKARAKVHNTLHGKVGMKERLLAAKSEEEIERLWHEAETYHWASQKTKRGWLKAVASARKTFTAGGVK